MDRISKGRWKPLFTLRRGYFTDGQMIIKRIFSGGDNLQKHLKDSVFHIVCERNLCSCMNNTKWCELINAIKMEMPFPPAFSMKYITEESALGRLDWREFSISRILFQY